MFDHGPQVHHQPAPGVTLEALVEALQGIPRDFEVPMIIGGQEVRTAEKIDSIDPSTNKLFCRAQRATRKETDLAIEAEEIIRVRQRMYEILSKHTGKDVKQIEADCDRNLWLDAEQAVEYGIADKILQRMPEASDSKR